MGTLTFQRKLNLKIIPKPTYALLKRPNEKGDEAVTVYSQSHILK
jgi:hypothetical protein